MIDAALQLIAAAEVEADPGAKAATLREAIDLLSTLDMSSAKIAYALGYAWYLVPEDTQFRNAAILRFLSAALRAQPDHRYARLYLAHWYFDTGQFSRALPLLLEFAPAEFASHQQPWRDVKNAELILACVLALQDVSQIDGAVQELLQRVSRLDADQLPRPAELVAVLQRLIHSLPPP